MNNNYEKLVKSALKLVAKSNDLDYDKLKSDAKKIIKLAKNYDEQLLGMMEELLDLPNVSCPEELADIDIDVLRIYCRIKEIDIDNSSERSIRRKVWENIEAEIEESDESELEELDDSDDSESELVEATAESDESEVELVEEPEVEPPVQEEPEKKKKVSKHPKKGVSVVVNSEP